MRSTRFPKRALALVVPMALVLSACGGGDDDAAVSFEEPAGDATVAGPVSLAMTADGLTIEEAGEVHEGSGHFHVIADAGCAEPGDALAKDADHVHFGKGQSDGSIYLEPGRHELCLQAGDGAHVALAATDTVSVTVGITTRDQWCAVVGEVDDLFLKADTDAEEFTVRRVGYENIRRLLLQLTDGIDQVDAAARPDVAESLAFGTTIAAAFADATDADAAEAALQEIFGAEGVQSDTPGAAWILDACGVDIDG